MVACCAGALCLLGAYHTQSLYCLRHCLCLLGNILHSDVGKFGSACLLVPQAVRPPPGVCLWSGYGGHVRAFRGDPEVGVDLPENRMGMHKQEHRWPRRQAPTQARGSAGE